MKKTLLFAFVLAAGFVATFMSGCTSESGPTCHSINGLDTGKHVVYLGNLPLDLISIGDSLDVSVNGTNITISSKALGQSLPGKVDPTDCNKIILDTIFIGSGASDTIKIPTTLPGIGGFVKIWSVEATGYGIVTPTGSTTRINIKKGRTNVKIGEIDITNIDNRDLNLRGTFLNR